MMRVALFDRVVGHGLESEFHRSAVHMVDVNGAGDALASCGVDVARCRLGHERMTTRAIDPNGRTIAYVERSELGYVTTAAGGIAPRSAIPRSGVATLSAADIAWVEAQQR